MSELNKKGKVCRIALWGMPAAFGAAVMSCLLAMYKAMYVCMIILAVAFIVFMLLAPQKYVDPGDKLLKGKL